PPLSRPPPFLPPALHPYTTLFRSTPLLFAEAYAHRDLVVELDVRAGRKRQDLHSRRLGVPDEVAGNRSPGERDIDMAGRQFLVDQLAGVRLRVSGLRGERHRLLD